MNEIRFFISANPAPGGSKSGFPIYKKHGLDPLARNISGCRPSMNAPCPTCGFTGRVAMTDAGGERNKLWRQEVSKAAMIAMKNAGISPFEGAVEIEMIFHMPRPKSHYRSNGVALRPGCPLHHVIRPDCTKLARSTEDALTGKCYVDDAQIVKQSHEKVYSDQAGAWVIIRGDG